MASSSQEEKRMEFLRAATWHGSLEQAESILSGDPALATLDIFTAAVTGNASLVASFIARDPALVDKQSPPYNGTPLVYLCLSKYLRLDRTREADFIAAAKTLIDAGADVNAGFWAGDKFPEFETALYGAAGVAHNEALTKLLLSFGADPNDGEAVYHSPEDYDNGAMKALVETGRVTPQNLVMMLIRKHDFHDYYGVKYLLEKGVDPNSSWGEGVYPLHHALKRDNHIAIIELLVEHGAATSVINDGLTAMARAAREGRGDVLKLFEEKGIAIPLDGVDQLIAACASGKTEDVRQILDANPALLPELLEMGDELLARFSCTGNVAGVTTLLDMGIPPDEPYKKGDGYYNIQPGSLPIHIAAWRNRPEVVQLLISCSSSINVKDANGYTPLALAVRACTVSYWSDRRTPDSIAYLLAAGATVEGIALPTGYDEADLLLQPYFDKQ